MLSVPSEISVVNVHLGQYWTHNFTICLAEVSFMRFLLLLTPRRGYAFTGVCLSVCLLIIMLLKTLLMDFDEICWIARQ